MIMPYKGILPQLAPSAFIESSAQLIGDIHVGEDSSVWFNCVIRADVNYVRIGKSTNVQDGSIVHVTGERFPTTLGDRVTVGHGVILHGCTIGDRSLVGIGAIVLDGVTVGEESIIAAGSLVTPGTIVPPRSMVMGSPARVKRQVTDEEIEWIDAHWKNYVEYKNSYLSQ